MEEGLLLKEESTRAIRAVTGTWGGEFKEEGGRLGRVALPMVAVTLSQYLVQVVSIMMAGHLGELSLAGASIASSLTSVTGFTLLSGIVMKD
ncbi:uncharacterized protein A4U43_UnF4220 [Asparagus officinalis]|uniref:Protein DETOXIFICATION n=1 Tax=Asparagus officinalis TaxID=4686 RepID=A0A1R3L6W9_ASPOF|nr:uncharacterized protein A4U43_UnF4220 [Asparagus officinalis]